MNHTRARTTRTAQSIDAFRRIVRAIRVADQQTRGAAGISAAQLFVLAVLADGAALSLTQLGARTHTDRTSVAHVVDRLVERGLVSRSRSAADRRRQEVEITPAGLALLRDAPKPPTALLLAGLEALEDGDLDALATGLLRLTGAMGLDDAPAPMLFEDESERPRSARRRGGR